MSLDTQKFIDMMIGDYYLNGKWKILNDARRIKIIFLRKI